MHAIFVGSSQWKYVKYRSTDLIHTISGKYPVTMIVTFKTVTITLGQKQLKLDEPRTEPEIFDFWNYQRCQKCLMISSKHLEKL